MISDLLCLPITTMSPLFPVEIGNNRFRYIVFHPDVGVLPVFQAVRQRVLRILGGLTLIELFEKPPA